VIESAVDPEPVHVVIVGGGPAALEALMAVRDLAGARVRVTLVAPQPEIELKALRTAAPFSVDHVRSYPVKDVAEAWGAELVVGELAEVRSDSRVAVLANGMELSYDALVIAVGARPRPAYSPQAASVFGDKPRDEMLNGLLADMEGGYAKSVAFVVPPGVSWPLPIYELALMTARQVWSMGINDAQITIVTPEDAPLAIFGPVASEAVRDLLDQANVLFRGGVYADVQHGGQINLRPGQDELHAQRVVALPLLDGPAVPGLPADANGFLPIDDHARVQGVDDVYATGDAANFPVKQGGLACQQSDAAAHMIAARAGAPVQAEPFHPVLRGKLLTGHGAQYLRTALHGGDGGSEASDFELWWPPTKISGRYLSRWLANYDPPNQESAQPGRSGAFQTPPMSINPPQSPAVDVDVVLPSAQQLRDDALQLDPYSHPKR
jgi:sulfide:quinone oxidoreductase